VNYAVLHYCFFALVAKKDYLPAQMLNIVVTVVKKSNPFPEKIEDQESIAGSLTILITRGLSAEVAETGDPVRKAENLVRNDPYPCSDTQYTGRIESVTLPNVY